MKVEQNLILVALPGAQRREGASNQEANIVNDSSSVSTPKSNTCAGEIEIKKACQKYWQIASKNADISRSVSSIDTGAIFHARLCLDISMNIVGMSVYAL